MSPSNDKRTCSHESIGWAKDGSDVLVCGDCDEQFTSETELRHKLQEMVLHDDTGDPHDEGYMAAVDELAEHFLGGTDALTQNRS